MAQEHEVRIKIGGPAGFGIKAAGQTLARSFARAGLDIFDLTEYPSLIKGGHNVYHVRVGRGTLLSHVLPVDVLVALDQATIDAHKDELTDGGALVFDPKNSDPGALDSDRTCLVPIPLDDIVHEAGGEKIMRNVAALGAVLGHMRFPLSYLTDSLKAQFAHKAPEIAEVNVAVAAAGYEHANRVTCDFPYKLEPVEVEADRILVDGNEAIALGALAAGIGLYAAYPMTPASSLLHVMAANAESQGVIVKHTEDEIAAMNMVVGAAFGGTRAMCATSGGGFSLMVEALGLAGASESAVVVGLFTRPGPATGLPTWTEQSDVRFAIHAAQGEFPRVVLAPGDREEAFRLTWQAFNLADRLQTPVILLGDSYLSDNRQSVPRFDTSEVEVDRGEMVTEGRVEGYLRYAVTDSGVSLRALPGVIGAEQVVNSYEHDERGGAAEGADMRVAQNSKRLRKLDLARDFVPPSQRHGPENAEISLVFFGTTKMPALQAMHWCEKDGLGVNALQIVTVWPFPADEVTTFIRDAKTTLCVEGNATGQLRGLIREHCLLDVDHSLHRFDGRPFSPEQIYAELMRLAGREVDVAPSGYIYPKEANRGA